MILNGDPMRLLAKKILFSCILFSSISTTADTVNPNPKMSFRDKIEDLVAQVDDFVIPKSGTEFIIFPILPLVSYYFAKKGISHIPQINSTGAKILSGAIASLFGLFSCEMLKINHEGEDHWCYLNSSCNCLSHRANRWNFLDMDSEAKLELLKLPYPEFLKKIGYNEKSALVTENENRSNWDMKKEMIKIKRQIKHHNDTNSWWSGFKE